MPIERFRPLLAIAATGLLAGCAAGSLDHLAGADPTWGEANRQTMAAQVIDPAPQYDTAVPESSGDHAAQAIERYRKGTVKEPDRIRTTNAGSLGSGGGGK